MINIAEVKETNDMIEKENLDVRTITLGISLLNCIDDNLEKLNEKTGVAIPKPLVGIKDREVLHKTHIDKTEIINFIKSEMEGL